MIDQSVASLMRRLRVKGSDIQVFVRIQIFHKVMSHTQEYLYPDIFNDEIRIAVGDNIPSILDRGTSIMPNLIATTGFLNSLNNRLDDLGEDLHFSHSVNELVFWWILRLIQGDNCPSPEQIGTDPPFNVSFVPDQNDATSRSERLKISMTTLSDLLNHLSTKNNHTVIQSAVLCLGIEHMMIRNGGRPRSDVIIDIMPLHPSGKQSVSEFNLYFKGRIYFPIYALCAETGDVLGCGFYPVTNGSPTDYENFIISVGKAIRDYVADHVTVRMDRVFDAGADYNQLEEEDLNYLMYLRTNPALEQLAEPHLGARLYEKLTAIELEYQASSWKCARRVILVVKPRAGEFFNDYYFLITNLSKDLYSGEDLASLYSQRGNAKRYQADIREACELSRSFESHTGSENSTSPVDDAECKAGERRKDLAFLMKKNTVRILLYLVSYQFMHIARELNHRAPPRWETETDDNLQQVQDGENCSDMTPNGAKKSRLLMNTFREHLLLTGAQPTERDGYLDTGISPSVYKAWERFFRNFEQLRWPLIQDF